MPKVVLIENVAGLARPRFAAYVDYLLRQLSLPEVTIRRAESWEQHSRRLASESSASGWTLRYRVSLHDVNAADYGVPQKRNRVIIVGWRDDLDETWQIPSATHNLDALLWDM
jgi:DNA (cytosine-5)-methyltransferase 1